MGPTPWSASLTIPGAIIDAHGEPVCCVEWYGSNTEATVNAVELAEIVNYDAANSIGPLHDEITRLRATLAERDAEIAHAMAYLSCLITILYPNCIPLEDLDGRISQIDNITTEIPKSRAEIAALRAEREWKPWDTAPPDIAKGLVYYPQFYSVEAATCIIYGQDEGEAIGVARATLDLDGGQWIPTHWQPLPPSPEAT